MAASLVQILPLPLFVSSKFCVNLRSLKEKMEHHFDGQLRMCLLNSDTPPGLVLTNVTFVSNWELLRSVEIKMHVF